MHMQCEVDTTLYLFFSCHNTQNGDVSARLDDATYTFFSI